MKAESEFKEVAERTAEATRKKVYQRPASATPPASVPGTLCTTFRQRKGHQEAHFHFIIQAATRVGMELRESPVSSHETGCLTQHSPHESRFVGSSSGVYFINTVRQAFASSRGHGTHCDLPAAEDTVGGEDDHLPSARNSPEPGTSFDIDTGSNGRSIEVTTRAQLGSMPTYEAAQQFAIAYFEDWHPVLPFLSGTEFLKELEAFYADEIHRASPGRRRQCYSIIFFCVLTMGANKSPSGNSSQSTVEISTRSHLLTLIATLASRHDILTIQTVLAAQIYCISTMALRTASSLGGILSKLLYHAGLHRCPYRYPQLSIEDRELRKRILWSAFAMDRYVCQALGIPVALTYAEIDVCVPGRGELHDTLSPDQARSDSSASSSQRLIDGETSLGREKVLANFVEYAGLVGRALELFHASIHTRNKDPRKILFLRSDVDKWYNSLPEERDMAPERNAAADQIARFLPFFHVLYEQLIISINRPSLSLPRSAPEFHHGLQSTIRAAKRTIVALERQDHLFWPGYLASVWMSGLILSFGCQIGLYNITQGSQEIIRCLALLKKMSDRWRSAQRCHAALSTLLSDLTPTQRHDSERLGNDSPPRIKRPRLNSMKMPSESQATAVGLSNDQAPANSQTSNDVQENGVVFSPAAWDVDDLFRDLSWNNLFDMNELEIHSDFSFLPG